MEDLLTQCPNAYSSDAGLASAAAAGGAGEGPVAGVAADESMSAALHKVVHEVLGDDLTLNEAQQMLAEVDAKNDGKISLAEVSLVHEGPTRPHEPLFGHLSTTLGTSEGSFGCFCDCQHSASARRPCVCAKIAMLHSIMGLQQ